MMNLSVLSTTLLFLSISFAMSASAADMELKISPRKIVSATDSQFAFNHMRRLDWGGDWDFSVGAIAYVQVEFKTPEGHSSRLIEQVEMQAVIRAPKGKMTSQFAADSAMHFNMKSVIENIRRKRPDLDVTGISVKAVKVWITNSFIGVGGAYLNLSTSNLLTDPVEKMTWPFVMDNSDGENFEFDLEIGPN